MVTDSSKILTIFFIYINSYISILKRFISSYAVMLKDV